MMSASSRRASTFDLRRESVVDMIQQQHSSRLIPRYFNSNVLGFLRNETVTSGSEGFTIPFARVLNRTKSLSILDISLILRRSSKKPLITGSTKQSTLRELPKWH
jgi:hypothetical protein